MCPYIHCTHNLWLVAGIDRPGRYRGHVPNTIADDWQSRPHNCELDYLEAAKGNEIEPRVVAEALGVSERQIRRGQESAKRKLARHEKAKRLLEEKTKR